MPSTTTSRLIRASVALATTALFIGLTTAPAAAVVSAVTVGGYNGLELRTGPDDLVELAVPLLVETSDGTQVVTYCVERLVATEPGVPYTEVDWSGVANLGNVLWVMEHAVPNVGLAALTDAVEAHAGVTITPDYDDFEANGITQAAIWAYTDGFDFGSVNIAYAHVYNSGTIPVPLDLARLQYLFDYLTDPAVNTGGTQPPPSLELDDSGATRDGDRYGPIVVSTTATSVALSLTGTMGAALVDADGTPVAEASDGDAIFVQLPGGASGSVSVSASTEEGELFAGRLFVAPGYQNLVTAETVTTYTEDAVGYSWSTLPATGPEVLAPAALAALLLLTAGGAVLLARREAGA